MVLSVNPVGGMLRAGAGLAKDTFLVVFCKSPAEQDVDETACVFLTACPEGGIEKMLTLCDDGTTAAEESPDA